MNREVEERSKDEGRRRSEMTTVGAEGRTSRNGLMENVREVVGGMGERQREGAEVRKK